MHFFIFFIIIIFYFFFFYPKSVVIEKFSLSPPVVVPSAPQKTDGTSHLRSCSGGQPRGGQQVQKVLWLLHQASGNSLWVVPAGDWWLVNERQWLCDKFLSYNIELRAVVVPSLCNRKLLRKGCFEVICLSIGLWHLHILYSNTSNVLWLWIRLIFFLGLAILNFSMKNDI